MVRIIAGTLIEIGQKKRRPLSMKDIIGSKDREQAGVTAPAKGLMMMEVYYDEGDIL
jgi:tRNA pseudouridine38-40 synthase